MCRHGLANLSLRPLAKAVGSSPRLLLYYFGSKDELVVEIIQRGRARQRETMANLKFSAGLSRAKSRGCSGATGVPPVGTTDAAVFRSLRVWRCRTGPRFPGLSGERRQEWLTALESCSTFRAIAAMTRARLRR